MKQNNQIENENKYEVLIVDDIPENLQVISNILYPEGLGISIATNGKEALEVVSMKSFDLILLDISMPEMDGFEVCDRLKQDTKTQNIPIIFLTARIQPKDIIRGFEVGAVDYVTKPYNTAELVARVFTHLELKKSRDLISNQNQELRQLNATRDKLFSIISHDLKSPIATSVGFAKLLIDQFDNYDKEKIKRSLDLIYASTKQGLNLLETLLEWSKAQTGKLNWNPQRVNLKEIVDENIALLNNIALDKNIVQKSSIQENLFVFADFHMLSTVIRNLLMNALKFTKRKGEVIVSANKVDNNHVEVNVKDTGIGIRKENLKKLFRNDMFYMTKGTENEKGSGLGLSLCKEFVEKNGGKIWAESEYKQGSAFKFTVPVAN